MQIGITGGIGSGKSIVCQIFRNLGVSVYDADSRAKWLMIQDKSLKQSIQSEFGSESYDSDGQVNKEYLSNVFSDSDRLEVLNKLVHPVVGSDYKRWANERINEPYLIKEAALLFESGSYKLLDKVITVYTPEFMRIQRVLKRDVYRTEQQVKTIIKRQYNEEKRLQMADFVIYNDESQLLITQVLKLHQQFLQMPLQVREDLL